MDTEGTGLGMPKDVAVKLHEYKEDLLLSQHPQKRVESFVGTYGEFMHGNLTIEESDFCEGCLFLQYGRVGRYILIPIMNSTDTFYGFNSMPPGRDMTATFGSLGEDGLYHEVYLPWDITAYIISPVTFIRDLTMDEAPEFPIESCD